MTAVIDRFNDHLSLVNADVRSGGVVHASAAKFGQADFSQTAQNRRDGKVVRDDQRVLFTAISFSMDCQARSCTFVSDSPRGI